MCERKVHWLLLVIRIELEVVVQIRLVWDVVDHFFKLKIEKMRDQGISILSRRSNLYLAFRSA
jgi:hypothetical protein